MDSLSKHPSSKLVIFHPCVSRLRPPEELNPVACAQWQRLLAEGWGSRRQSGCPKKSGNSNSQADCQSVDKHEFSASIFFGNRLPQQMEFVQLVFSMSSSGASREGPTSLSQFGRTFAAPRKLTWNLRIDRWFRPCSEDQPDVVERGSMWSFAGGRSSLISA